MLELNIDYSMSPELADCEIEENIFTLKVYVKTVKENKIKK